MSNINFTEFSNGVVIVNTTPHPVTIQELDGSLVSVPVSELVNAKVVEEQVSDLYVTTKFEKDPSGEDVINRIKAEYYTKYLGKCLDKVPTLIILGSVIAAQAYPGEVVGMTPVPGYERVAPAEKRMRCDKFTIYK